LKWPRSKGRVKKKAKGVRMGEAKKLIKEEKKREES